MCVCVCVFHHDATSLEITWGKGRERERERERERDGDRESVRVCLCGECMWRMCHMYVKLWRGVSPLCPVCIRRCGVCRWYVPACTRNLDEILFSLTPKPETRNNKRRHLDTIPLGVVQGNSRLMAFFFWHRERERRGGVPWASCKAAVA